MLKKLLPAVLATMMIISAFVYIAPSAAPVKIQQKLISLEENGVLHETNLPKWDGTTRTQPAEGDGSPSNPYKISTAEELAWYAKKINSAVDSAGRNLDAVLTRDIDLNGKNWRSYSIGLTWYYGGSFDGQGHTISGLFCDYQQEVSFSGMSAAALFTSLGENGVVTLKNSYLSKLAVGTYRIGFRFADGDASGTFTVTVAADATNPTTGDPIVVWVGMMVVSMLAAGALVLAGRRNRR